MDWFETLGPARPVMIKNWILPASISAAELRVVSEALLTDDAGYKNNVNLCRICKCLYALAKMEAEGKAELEEVEEFHDFYKLLLHVVEMFLTHVPCLKLHTSDVLLYNLGLLVDLAKFVLSSVNAMMSPQKVNDAICILRALCKALDRDTPFHQQHEHIPLPTALLDGPRRFVTCKSLPTSAEVCSNPGKRKRRISGVPVNVMNFCKCPECGLSSPESYLWVKCLVEYFGRGCAGYGPRTHGFDNIRELLPHLHELPIELTEIVLQLFARMTEYLRDDLRSNLLHPFMKFMQNLSSRCEQELDEQCIEVYVMILKHARRLLNFFLPGELGQRVIRDFEGQIQRMLLSFMTVETDNMSESSPRSLMMCEEVSSAKSNSYVGRILDQTAQWFKYKFPLTFNPSRALSLNSKVV
ncbi:hypothetical protein MPTK1_6g19540 [Marchantia polymorpha subsp. ruderalis]|nr:hypothetical protein MARPO_0045s0109 [Marchantia polymorpha]BBN15431.1 hypothetical protein Mp_6g19540 [Marchantia polymorpha subsp. ruderalis]|eukprot:PTQ39457.1 hypothetical protein MARPO_0045s0109 [Marchantia polymorpha]